MEATPVAWIRDFRFLFHSRWMSWRSNLPGGKWGWGREQEASSQTFGGPMRQSPQDLRDRASSAEPSGVSETWIPSRVTETCCSLLTRGRLRNYSYSNWQQLSILCFFPIDLRWSLVDLCTPRHTPQAPGSPAGTVQASPHGVRPIIWWATHSLTALLPFNGL